MGYLVDNDLFPGCPWDLLIPCWLQFARFSQGQQAEQAGIEGPSENSHFIVLIFYISSKGHCWAVLRRSAAPRISSFGKRKPRFLLPDGPTASREGILPNYIFWFWFSEMILGFWLPCNILHRLGVPTRSWRGRRQCLSWPETGWERGKLLGGEWQTCRRRVFLLSKISVFLLLLQVQHKLAELKTALSVCRAFVDSCLSLHNISKLDSEMASMAKYWATDLENRVAGDCLQLHGGKTFQYHHWFWCPPSFCILNMMYFLKWKPFQAGASCGRPRLRSATPTQEWQPSMPAPTRSWRSSSPEKSQEIELAETNEFAETQKLLRKFSTWNSIIHMYIQS